MDEENESHNSDLGALIIICEIANGETLKDISNRNGVSVERIRQVIFRCMRRYGFDFKRDVRSIRSNPEYFISFAKKAISIIRCGEYLPQKDIRELLQNSNKIINCRITIYA